MLRIWILAVAPLLAAQAPADLFQKAPPAVDGALRARIQQFYQYHVDGKFRQAEALVADESKDDFFTAQKHRCLKFEVPRIDYSDNFTKAKAVVTCNMYVNMIGFMDKPLPVPLPSYWKLIDGQWYWYAPPVSRDTPFGKMTPGGASAGPSPMPAPILPKGNETQAVLQQVKADRTSLQFKAREGGSGQITISNAMEGKIRVSLTVPPQQAIQASLDRSEVDAGGKAVITVKAAPAKAAPGPVTLEVSVMPTGQVIPIQITYAQ